MAKRKKPPTGQPPQVSRPGREQLPNRELEAMAGDRDPSLPTPPSEQRRRPEKKPTSPIRRSGQAKLWDERLGRAKRLYEDWEKKYECKKLDDYYEGKQWRGLPEEDAKEKYSINLVFATVESQIPSLMFSKPKVQVEARPQHEQTTGSHAGGRATLIEQTLQTLIEDQRVGMMREANLALRDVYSRYGIVEIGYSANWIENPNAGRPILIDNQQEMKDPDTGEVLKEPPKVLPEGEKESLYVKHLDPENVRVSPGRPVLLQNDWVAAFEWVSLQDVKRNPDYDQKARDTLQATGRLAPGDSDDQTERESDEERDERQARRDQVKVWRIWDLRRNMMMTHAEGHGQMLNKGEEFETFPLVDLRFYPRRKAFLPLPPIFNWLSPQDEINETREMQRTHRRRFIRRYMYEGQLDDTELEKLESGEDGVAIKVPKTNPPPIVPIQDAPLDGQKNIDLATAREDLNQIAGVTGETRNTPSAPTATQANIMNTRQAVRESYARGLVAEFLANICRVMLLTIRERVKLPFMVKRSMDPFAMFNDPEQLQSTAQSWMEVKGQDISDLDVDISIDVATLSPVAEEAARNNWNVILALLSKPEVSTWLMTPNPLAPQEPSPLLRKTLVLNGIKSDQEIREIWRIGQMLLKQAAEAAAAAAALQKQAEPPKVSVALKAEDIIMALGPLEGAAEIRNLLAMSQPAMDAAATARPMPSPMAPGGNGSGGPSVSLDGQSATGIPSAVPPSM